MRRRFVFWRGSATAPGQRKRALRQSVPEFSSTRHGDRSGQRRKACVAHCVDLSLWQEVQGLGILYLSVIAGEMKAKV
jgi:hypothetical protein